MASGYNHTTVCLPVDVFLSTSFVFSHADERKKCLEYQIKISFEYFETAKAGHISLNQSSGHFVYVF